MSYNAEVFKVFIASPSDVAHERAIIREVLSRWNNIHSERYNIVLSPVGWETHSTPEVGDTPQKLLNKQILEDSDLLIGVFWTRFGTPTEDYESGTEEEIEKHIEKGKPTMLYFSNKPVIPDSINGEQYEKVKKFKEKYKNKSIYNEYSSTEEFQHNLSEHIQLKINNHDYFKVTISDNSGFISLKKEEDQIQKDLSEESKLVLKEGANDRIGYIHFIKVSVGRVLEVNGKQLLNGGNPRERAKWEAAFAELERFDLIESTDFNGEVFKLTNKGYKVADLL